MILQDDSMNMLTVITYDGNEPRDVAKVPVLAQGFDAYFFDFMNCFRRIVFEELFSKNCFRRIQSLSFLVCDNVLNSMKMMNKIARFSA
jgi:hypothetical protein